MDTQRLPAGDRAEAVIAGTDDSNLGAALGALLSQGYSDAEHWRALAESGATDKQIRSALTFLVGPSGRADSTSGIALIHTKPKLAFWLGSYGVGKPALEGDALVTKVREVLSIPGPKAAEPEAAVADLALVPGDPHGRGWPDLSDAELTEWRGALASVAGDYARAQLALVDAEIARRQSGREDGEAGRLPTEAEVLAAHSARVAGQLEEARADVEQAQQAESLGPGQQPALVQISLFDYSQLPGEDADRVQRNTREIRERVVSTLNNMLVIGQRLRDNKSILGRKYYTEWLTKEIGFSQDSSERYIRLADYVDENPHFAEILGRFDKTAAHMLLAPSTPEEAREEAIARAGQGERITSAKAREIVEAHKEEAVPQEPEAAAEEVADYETSDEVENPASAGAVVVATGRTSADLLALLKANPDGMTEDDLVKLGFSAATLESLRVEGLAKKQLGGNWLYAWKGEDIVRVIREEGPLTRTALEAMGCDGLTIRMAERDRLIKRGSDGRFNVVVPEPEGKPDASAKPDKTQPATIEELLGGRMLVVTYTYLPAVPRKVIVGVRVGDDATKFITETLDSSKVRHTNERVLEMIAGQIKAAGKDGGRAKDAPKKPAPSKQSKPAARAAPPKKKAATKKTASRLAAKKAPAAKKTVAIKKGGG